MTSHDSEVAWSSRLAIPNTGLEVRRCSQAAGVHTGSNVAASHNLATAVGEEGPINESVIVMPATHI